MLRSLDGRWKALLAMVAAFLCLLGLNGVISQTVIDISPLPVAMSASISSARSAGTNQSPLLADLTLPETLARPVFSPTRRDFVQPPPAEEPAEVVVEQALAEPGSSLPPLKLQGTRAINGKFSALVATGETSADWFGEGAKIAGWTIVSITAETMSLSSGSQSAVVSLYEVGKAQIGGAED